MDHTDLEFGTGGIRAIMGPASNQLNIHTIQRATEALANYINENLKTTNHPRAVICYDSRHNSKLFAHHAAKVLASQNIEVWISNDIRPTPFASFMVRRKEAAAGIMITASHNTAEYNGYKVYGPDGGQVVFPHDQGIMQEYDKITTLSNLKENSHLIHFMDSSDDAAYLKAILSLKIHGKESHDFGSQIRIVYTSLHGCGVAFIPKALKEWGFSDLHLVDKQCIPDGSFPTAPKPNPEEPSALSLGISLLEKEKADLLIATDPDADRVGIVCMHHGAPHILTGNEIATLCLYHLVNTMQQKGFLTRSDTVISTIVTTRLLRRIAEDFNILYMDTLTGFKYIGEKIALFEKESPPHRFLFGAEESYGYLIGTHARDKDATIASCFIAEMALHLKLKNQTLIDQLYDIYQLYGIYQSHQETIYQDHRKIMAALRDPNITQLCGIPVSYIEDYKTSICKNVLTGQTTLLNLPKSDVIVFKFEDESEIVVRPSGTEPKLKIYGSMTLRSFIDVPSGIKDVTLMLKKRLGLVRTHLENLLAPCV
jgi:phosphomannomutase